ncbi:DNA primase [Candidatus Sulfobium mesophilum]|uniref:DNA primase n=1 Tax=Candidatus Sulfobium mesophilum TaxID=2016548 RepID=A0A2U3QEX3_9BACT|nr:DNA primase [Candidatus Sulfobium mesophilum]
MKSGRLLEDIKTKNDIVDFISSYVQLKKSGQNWKGNCPFHSEKTPSFMVSPSKQIFHCFGCGAGGDIITFVMKHENISFQEAITLLAKRAGVPLPSEGTDKRASQKYEKLRDVLSEAGRYYVTKLKDSARAAAYLRDRGIDAGSIDTFGIGFAPAGWDNLLRHLRGKGCSDALIKEAGLAVQGNKGFYDMFRHRIIFPITGMSGGIIAFGGRALDGSAPKYINSPETTVFKKSDSLFGLSAAKDEIRKQGRVIIAEGYMDVIICHQYGFKQVVAPLGTALTPGHIQKLRALSSKAVLVFDGDAAGRSAARRALALMCHNNYMAKVLLLPDGEDPDSYLRKYGAESFDNQLRYAKSVVDFLFSVPAGDNIEIVREALTLISGVKDLLFAGEMLRELAERAGISESTIREEFKRVKGLNVTAVPGPRRAFSCEKKSEEHLLLSALISFPEKSDYILSRLDMDDIEDKVIASLLRKIATLGEMWGATQILDIADDEERKMVTRYSLEPGLDPEQIDKSIEGCFRRIEQRKLSERLRLAQTSGDAVLANSLLLEKRSLEERGL